MKERVYVAGSLKDVERVRGVMNLVRLAGHEVILDWTKMELPANGDDGSLGPELQRAIALAELRAVTDASLVILLYQDNLLGALLETGAALSAGKDIWVVNADRASVFWSLPGVELVAPRDLYRRLRDR